MSDAATAMPTIPTREAAPEGRAALPPVRDDYAYYYRHWHDDGDAHFEAMVDHFAGKLAPLLPAAAGARVLEVGCGWGFALAALRRLGAEAEGFDTDATAIEIARRRNLPATRLALDDIPAFMEARAAQYDAVVAFDVLEHVPRADQMGFLRGVLGVLKPGGRFICQVPNANSPLSARFRYNDWTHHASFAEHSLGFVLHRAGFDRISVREADPDPRPSLLRPKDVACGGLRRLTRGAWRLAYMAELGRRQGASLPMSPNILALAHR